MITKSFESIRSFAKDLESFYNSESCGGTSGIDHSGMVMYKFVCEEEEYSFYPEWKTIYFLLSPILDRNELLKVFTNQVDAAVKQLKSEQNIINNNWIGHFSISEFRYTLTSTDISYNVSARLVNIDKLLHDKNFNKKIDKVLND